MNFAANEPCPRVPLIPCRTWRYDLIETMLRPANDNDPSTAAGWIERIKADAERAAAGHRPA